MSNDIERIEQETLDTIRPYYQQIGAMAEFEPVKKDIQKITKPKAYNVIMVILGFVMWGLIIFAMISNF